MSQSWAVWMLLRRTEQWGGYLGSFVTHNNRSRLSPGTHEVWMKQVASLLAGYTKRVPIGHMDQGCLKIMFTQVSVCPQREGVPLLTGPWSLVTGPFWGSGMEMGRGGEGRWSLVPVPHGLWSQWQKIGYPLVSGPRSFPWGREGYPVRSYDRASFH